MAKRHKDALGIQQGAVNWLTCHAGLPIMNRDSDAYIAANFRVRSERLSARLVAVTISTTEG